MEVEHRVMPLIFVLTGTANVLLLKFADISEGIGIDGKSRNFQHPLFQTMLMFLGQFLLLAVYKSALWFLRRRQDGSENENIITRGSSEFSIFSLILPAFLDAIATILLLTGLYLTYASSFQMIRGAAIIFVGLFSSMYLNQALISRHWIAMFTIFCGITIIFSIDMQRVLYDRTSIIKSDSNALLTGELLIICAQVFYAAQIVYTEKHLKQADVPPMLAAGLQGFFGFFITAILAAALNFVPTELSFVDNTHGVFDDLSDVFVQLRSNTWLCVAMLTFVITVALYNFAVFTIIKFSSSANLILADGLRVMLIWLFVLLFKWESINLISLMGFVILQMGAVAYRNAIFLEWYRSVMAKIMRRRYADLTVESESGMDVSGVPSSSPADVI